MVFFQAEENIDERIKLLELLERINFFSLLIGNKFYYLYDDNNKIFEILDVEKTATNLSKKEITPEKLIKSLEEVCDSIVDSKDLLKSAKNRFKDTHFYKWSGIQYFLFEYDLSLQSQSKTSRQKINWTEFYRDYESIEHIYPQNPKKDCWLAKFNHYSSDERTILKHSLGNLLPLSKPKNSSFSNSCFKDKISNSKNTVGYLYGSYSENEIANYKDWTASEILERGIKLLEFMEDRWGLNIGAKNDKIKFLNLEFVTRKEKESKASNSA